MNWKQKIEAQIDRVYTCDAHFAGLEGVGDAMQALLDVAVAADTIFLRAMDENLDKALDKLREVSDE